MPANDTVIMAQLETQVYYGEHYDVVIHQVTPYGGGENQTIGIQVEHVDTLIAALQRVKKEVIEAREESGE